MTWLYDGKDFLEPDESDYGFVYLITNKLSGKKYIGRKYFTAAGYKTVKGKRKKIRKQSDWLDYYGSNKELQLDVETHGKENFTREILRICKSRGATNYWEAKYQFQHDVLLDDNYYNDWIMVKTHRKHIKKEA